jgi:hypothetical protein
MGDPCCTSSLDVPAADPSSYDGLTFYGVRDFNWAVLWVAADFGLITLLFCAAYDRWGNGRHGGASGHVSCRHRQDADASPGPPWAAGERAAFGYL